MFYPWLLARKEHGYYWNYLRLADEQKPTFLTRYVEEFSKNMAAGELEKRVFTAKAWERMCGILRAPQAHVPDPDWDTDHSSALRYLREHGLRYVLRKADEKLRQRQGRMRGGTKKQ